MDIVTLHDVKKMNFNEERREIKSLADYMRIYLQILHMAFEHDFISLEQRDGIANTIWIAIQKLTQGNEIAISNYVYLISQKFLYLSNYEALELMLKITNQEEASSFALAIREEFLRKMDFSLARAKNGYEMACELRNNGLVSAWKSCHNALKLIDGCLEPGYSGVELKTEHDRDLEVIFGYDLMHTVEGVAYPERLQNFVRCFQIETSILKNGQAGKFLKAIAEERKKAIQYENVEDIQYAQQEYDEAVRELEELDALYSEKINRASNAELHLSNIEDIFHALYLSQHPDYNEDDPEQFEEYLDEYEEYLEMHDAEEYDSYDAVVIEYNSAREELQNRINRCKEILDSFIDDDLLEQISDTITLSDLLKEYAIMFLAQNGTIPYPTTAQQKEEILSKLPNQMATQIFLRNEEIKVRLTSDELSYLEF